MVDEATKEQVKERGREVAQTASGEAGRVAESAKEQAADVRHEVAAQGQHVVAQATQQFRKQADAQAQEAARGLHRLSGQARALAEGRADEAGPLGDYVRQASERIEGFAGRIEQRGPDALLEDVQTFARRRPGLFLAGAAVAGFAAGRLIRGASAASSSEPSSPQQPVATRGEEATWPPPPLESPTAVPSRGDGW